MSARILHSLHRRWKKQQNHQKAAKCQVSSLLNNYFKTLTSFPEYIFVPQLEGPSFSFGSGLKEWKLCALLRCLVKTSKLTGLLCHCPQAFLEMHRKLFWELVLFPCSQAWLFVQTLFSIPWIWCIWKWCMNIEQKTVSRMNDEETEYVGAWLWFETALYVPC